MTQTSATTTNPVETKVCSTCGVPKDINDFYKDSRAADGRYSECRECHVGRVTRRRPESQESARAREFTEQLQGRWREAFDAISTQMCSDCAGAMALVKAGEGRLCKCVHEKIFDDIMTAYEQSSVSAGCMGEITEHRVPGFGGGVSYSRKNQEFVADVEIALKRVSRKLDAEFPDFPHHESLMRLVIVGQRPLTPGLLATLGLGAFQREQARKALDAVAVRFAVESVEMQPYPLFPVQKYFNESPINTLQGEPNYRRDIRIALQRDTAARSAANYDRRAYR